MTEMDTFQGLNQEFYAASPSTYFHDRLQMLVLRGANPSLIDDNVSKETVWGTLRAALGPEPQEESAETAAEREAAHSRFLVTDSQILLHHAAEALLRMYLAHEARAECPWLEIAAFKDGIKFREELDSLAQSAWPQERIDATGWVFLGDAPENPPAEWLAQRDAAVRLLRILARNVNSDNQLYNGIKHGFTAIGGAGAIHFLPGDTTQPTPDLSVDLLEREALLGADGINVSYLEREGTRKRGTWYHTTQWVNSEKTAYLAQLAIIQMEALWTIARFRYLGEAPSAEVHVVTNEGLDLLKRFPLNGNVQLWRRKVATDGEPDRPAVS